MDFAQQLGIVNFRTSSEWLDKLKSRHKIVFKVICGKSADHPKDDCNT